MRIIRRIVVHYTATPAEREVTVKEIDQWHRARGFKEIGYHYVVHQDGSVQAGRSEDKVGAHVKGRNTDSIGVCYVGGLIAGKSAGSNTLTERQEEGLIKCIKELLTRYPDAEVVGHKDLAATQCPGFDVKRWWKKVK